MRLLFEVDTGDGEGMAYPIESHEYAREASKHVSQGFKVRATTMTEEELAARRERLILDTACKGEDLPW